MTLITIKKYYNNTTNIANKEIQQNHQAALGRGRGWKSVISCMSACIEIHDVTIITAALFDMMLQ